MNRPQAVRFSKTIHITGKRGGTFIAYLDGREVVKASDGMSSPEACRRLASKRSDFEFVKTHMVKHAS